MNKLYQKISKFMTGRYGIDDLYKFSVILYFLLIITNNFIKSSIITISELIILIIIIYRFFSKKTHKRNRENQVYLKVKEKLLRPLKNIKKNIKDKNYIYRTCHHCHKTLKLPLPSKRGVKHCQCPACQRRNTFIILKKYKVEIITN